MSALPDAYLLDVDHLMLRPAVNTIARNSPFVTLKGVRAKCTQASAAPTATTFLARDFPSGWPGTGPVTFSTLTVTFIVPE